MDLRDLASGTSWTVDLQFLFMTSGCWFCFNTTFGSFSLTLDCLARNGAFETYCGEVVGAGVIFCVGSFTNLA